MTGPAQSVEEGAREGGSHTTTWRQHWRFFAVALVFPTFNSLLGTDGSGAIFQIVAVESLGLDPRAIGIAFGMGVLSVPIQVMAARMPLWRARRNLQLFFVLEAILCFELALLVALDVAGEPIALIALGIAVIAEINVSVLYAPAWQPLLSYAMTSEHRQTINSRVRAAGGVLVAAVMIAFGAADDTLRMLLLAAVGMIAVLLAIAGRRLAAPDRPAETEGTQHAVTARRPRVPSTMKLIYVSLGLAAIAAAWPLFLVYAREVLWPTANLGLLGATQLAGALLAAAAWRPTVDDITPRALRASAVLVTATLAVAVIRPPVTTPAEGLTTFVALAAAAAAAQTILLALLERAHREIDNETAVKALTILDVVGSTSAQAGLLIAGFLISISASRVDWLLDPYRVYLLAGAFSIALALAVPSLSRSRKKTS